MFNKVRPNVIALAILICALAWMFSQTFASLGETVATVLISTTIGGLIATMGQVGTDTPAPTVPADVHKELVETALARRGRRPSEE